MVAHVCTVMRVAEAIAMRCSADLSPEVRASYMTRAAAVLTIFDMASREQDAPGS